MEGELKKEITKNEQLTGVVVNMQRSLNKLDAVKRETNLIINGLSEEEITTNDESLIEDSSKIKYLLHSIGINNIDQELNEFEYNRIGDATNGRNRLLKINVRSKATRDKICKEM